MFCGSRSRGGTLVEGAYCGLLFREGLIADATIQTRPRDPLSYGPTQQLGAWMRDQGIEAFAYLSTRC